MDLGCIDMGCIDKKPKETTSLNNDSTANMADSKSNSSVLNKLTSQIKKPSMRKSSPINWFPRKKVDSFLKRKIKLLQEVEGMNLTLDETLGDANPHYSRVLREKMAVKEAAHKAMEARKAAMVEASWFRILKASRIESKVAEAQLLKAEECAAKAFEAATAIGVIMYDAPECPTNRYKIETTSPKGGSTTHTIKASFETAFEVDKQVAAAVKSAFMKLETCPSIDKDDLKNLICKISEHPDLHEHSQEQSECSSEYESDMGADTRVETRKKRTWDTNYEKKTPVRQKKQKKRHAITKFNKDNLVDMMLERLKGLPEDGLSSLATIVATCGLSAALAEADIGVKQDLGSVAEDSSTHHVSRSSSFRTTPMNGHMRKEIPDSELPSLDKFLVKRLTRLEREVLEAKNARKNEQKPDKSNDNDCSVSDNACSGTSTSDFRNDLRKNPFKSEEKVDTDLGSILVKHTSKLEKEIEEARKKDVRLDENARKKEQKPDKPNDNDCSVSDNACSGTITSDFRNGLRKNSFKSEEKVDTDLGSILVKHTSKLEKEIAEARTKDARLDGRNGNNQDKKSGIQAKDVIEVPSLDTYLLKHTSRLEKEVEEAKETKKYDHVLEKENIDMNTDRISDYAQRQHRNHPENSSTFSEGLDKVLVKHVSRLEKEKLKLRSEEEIVPKMKSPEESRNELEMGEPGLDKVLVKHKSSLEIEKAQQTDTQIRHSSTRRLAREKELEEAWGGLSLGNSMHPRPSKLEKDKQTTEVRRSSARRDAREKELQESWGGLSLGNSMRPHLSKLEKDKAAWLKAEEEERSMDGFT